MTDDDIFCWMAIAIILILSVGVLLGALGYYDPLSTIERGTALEQSSQR